MEQLCKVCANRESNRLHTAREMAFGLRNTFTYLECGGCGCVQLLDVPRDMAKYYPPGYYSLQPHGTLKTWLRRRWSAHAFGRKNLAGWLVSEMFFPHRPMLAFKRANPAQEARILDVGCGRGYLLQDLADLGFRNLTGADPFVQADLTYPNGVKVFKRTLSEMKGQFDLIMLNHSFEHMDQPSEVMQQVGVLLASGGQVILGIPVASSFAWKHYGVNWVNLDAPRHLFLHTFKSIEILTGKAGLKIESIYHEGNDEQFWASEQFANNIPSNDPRSLSANALKRLWNWPKIRACRAKAEELNRAQQGDLVCFHLRKK